MRPQDKPLTDRERRFADLVLDGLPLYKAYRESGYQSSNDQTASTCASRLVRRPHVAQYMERQKESMQKASELTRQSLIGKLARVIDRLDKDESYPLHRAVDQFTALMGWDSPQKIELGAGESLWELVNRRNDQLKKAEPETIELKSDNADE